MGSLTETGSRGSKLDADPPPHGVKLARRNTERQWTPIRIERQLTLAKIMDEGLLFHGVDASVSASDD